MIGPFRGKYDFLSNFYHAPFKTEAGTFCKTVEHAFQACKTLNKGEQQNILRAKSPGIAKFMGRRVTLRPDWDSVKLSIMYRLVKLKFEQNLAIKAKLLATGNEDLEEVNYWGDTYWGTVDGEGENYLGKILMRVRSELA